MITPSVTRISRIMRPLSLALMIAVPLAVALVWWKFDFLVRELPGMSHLPIQTERIGTGTRLLGFAVHMVPAGIAVYGFHQLHRLFELYAAGEVFTMECVTRLSRFAHALLAYGIASPVTMRGRYHEQPTWRTRFVHRTQLQ